MNKQPLVTIVIPCYNYAEYVGEAIESVINQTYSNIELIVINDGSTDNSDNVIKKLQKKYNFKYINQHNQGIIAVRNQAINVAKGEYLVQLDADDYIDKTYIKKCLKAAIKFDVDIVYTQVKFIGRVDFTSNYIDFDLEKLKHDNYIHASSLVKKSILINKKYDSYLNDKGYEDWDIFLDLCLRWQG